MRVFISYLFLGAIVLHTLSRLIIHVDFLVNQDYIAENLCENKDKPVLQCNGSCQLKLELEKDEERKEKTVKHQVEIISSIVEQTHFDFEQSEIEIVTEKPQINNFQSKPIGYIQSIFHPPSV